eukprot:TRINITY_DN8867_c0_g1_i1.p1 TRINITY_DN8867_c0_g1~~TRINITY_DN8867_c0_g1_i1.p1  ORF type:complete len:598 (-),score=54.80 TRINITY_DN8867_c0_g1_i1:258-2051(-)
MARESLPRPNVQLLWQRIDLGERALHDEEFDSATSSLFPVVLDEILRSFSPWVQQLYLLRAQGAIGEDRPEALEVFGHLLPLYYFLQSPAMPRAMAKIAAVLRAAMEHGSIDLHLAQLCQSGFPVALEVISGLDRLSTTALDKAILRCSRMSCTLASRSERHMRLKEIVNLIQRMTSDLAAHTTMIESQSAGRCPMRQLGRAAFTFRSRTFGSESECDEFFSASEGEDDHATSATRHPCVHSGSIAPATGAEDIKEASALTAQEKRDALWAKIKHGQASRRKYPDIKALMQDAQSKDFSSLFTFTGDTHPDGIEKVVCSSGGVVAPVRVEWNSQAKAHFTGMFRCAEFGLLRLSSVTEPRVPSKFSPWPALLPMVALKLFRDGTAHSANVVLARQKSGQSELNIFAHASSNHFTENLTFPFKEALKVVKKYSCRPTFTGLADFATLAQNAEAEERVVAPYALVIFPPEKLRTRKIAFVADIFEQVKTFDAGDHLYEIYAVPEPLDASRVKHPRGSVWRNARLEDCPNPKAIWRVGDIFLSAPFTLSDYADQKLFFQHHAFEGDLRIRPEWQARVDPLIGAPHYQTLIEHGDLWEPTS